MHLLGTEKEVQQPEQLKEQDQANEVLKVNHKQLQLTIEEIEREMEGLGNTLPFESSTMETRDKLAKVQVHCIYNVEMTM